jgi:hypothetical protein
MALTAPSKAARAIVGPLISDITDIRGNQVTLATAFYTGGALSALNVEAQKLRLLIRLDLRSIREWALGSLDPLALRDFVERHEASCKQVSLFISPAAHAKIYSGDTSYLIGSANLSTRALSGNAAEILWSENEKVRLGTMGVALDEYAKMFRPCTLRDLQGYIDKNERSVESLKRSIPEEILIDDEDRLPSDISRPARLGDYDAFLKWLSKRTDAASRETLARARGKSNLSGHIRQAFYGTRQFLLGRPQVMRQFIGVDPTSYSFLGDANTVLKLGEFVRRHARDEESFSSSKWQTYLPASAGGRQHGGGATSGNLNRMLPLMAKYLDSLIGK